MVQSTVIDLFVGEGEFFVTEPGQVAHQSHWGGAQPGVGLAPAGSQAAPLILSGVALFLLSCARPTIDPLQPRSGCVPLACYA